MKIKKFNTKKKVLVIGEIGNNHEGNFFNALKLIDMAKRAGVDAVKFQTYKTENFIDKKDKKNFHKFKKFELSFSSFKKLSIYARKKGLLFISTPLDIESYKFLDQICDAIKIASSDNNFSLLINKVLKNKKPVIISTGFLNTNQINHLTDQLNRKKRKNIAILHCVSAYPAAYDEINLSSLKKLKHSSNIEIGYSDHTIGVEASLCAVSLGARIIEKHITLNKKFSKFRDHLLSSDFLELKQLVEQIRKIEILLGKPFKKVQKREKKILNQVRRKIFAAKNINKNDLLNENNLNFLRTSRKIKQINFDNILNKKSKYNYCKDDVIEI